MPTVASGYSDWADTEVASDAVRRIGIVHAAANATASWLFAASLVAAVAAAAAARWRSPVAPPWSPPATSAVT